MLAIDVAGEWYDPAIEELTEADPDLAQRWQEMFKMGEAQAAADPLPYLTD